MGAVNSTAANINLSLRNNNNELLGMDDNGNAVITSEFSGLTFSPIASEPPRNGANVFTINAPIERLPSGEFINKFLYLDKTKGIFRFTSSQEELSFFSVNRLGRFTAQNYEGGIILKYENENLFLVESAGIITVDNSAGRPITYWNFVKTGTISTNASTVVKTTLNYNSNDPSNPIVNQPPTTNPFPQEKPPFTFPPLTFPPPSSTFPESPIDFPDPPSSTFPPPSSTIPPPSSTEPPQTTLPANTLPESSEPISSSQPPETTLEYSDVPPFTEPETTIPPESSIEVSEPPQTTLPVSSTEAPQTTLPVSSSEAPQTTIPVSSSEAPQTTIPVSSSEAPQTTLPVSSSDVPDDELFTPGVIAGVTLAGVIVIVLIGVGIWYSEKKKEV